MVCLDVRGRRAVQAGQPQPHLDGARGGVSVSGCEGPQGSRQQFQAGQPRTLMAQEKGLVCLDVRACRARKGISRRAKPRRTLMARDDSSTAFFTRARSRCSFSSLAADSSTCCCAAATFCFCSAAGLRSAATFLLVGLLARPDDLLGDLDVDLVADLPPAPALEDDEGDGLVFLLALAMCGGGRASATLQRARREEGAGGGGSCVPSCRAAYAYLLSTGVDGRSSGRLRCFCGCGGMALPPAAAVLLLPLLLLLLLLPLIAPSVAAFGLLWSVVSQYTTPSSWSAIALSVHRAWSVYKRVCARWFQKVQKNRQIDASPFFIRDGTATYTSNYSMEIVVVVKE